MKNYLKDPLSEDEKNYISAIIYKTILKYQRNLSKKLEKEIISIDDDEFSEQLLTICDTYNLDNNLSKLKILRGISALKPYTRGEQERIVEILEKIAKDDGLFMFIAPLTFNEKLVVFLLYLAKYQVNQVATLLNVDRRTICNRENKIKNKFNKVKGDLKDER